MNFFATTPKGLELLLAEELRQLGAIEVAEKLAGVVFTADLAVAYKACLWSRLANRILLRLTEFPAPSPAELYAGIQTIAWDEHLAPTGTLNVNFICSHSNITHSLYGAQTVKDAIVDQFRAKFNVRPDVAREKPQLAIHVYLQRNIATVSLDLAGESLHKRDYRLEQGSAPLKENLAAAILLRANWPKIAAAGGALVDPMCGSGTFLIEAALLAGDIAPGLLRQYYGFFDWKKHLPAVWATLLNEAKQRAQLATLPPIVGYDADPEVVKIALANIKRAGLQDKIQVETREIAASAEKNNLLPGLVVVNPPYGERLGEVAELKILYERLGEKLKQNFLGWQAAVLTSNPELGKNMGIRAHRHYALFNGTLACQLLLFNIDAEKFVDRSPAANNARRIRAAMRNITEQDRLAVQSFVNRLQKKLRHLRRQAKRQNISHYRVYDGDVPEYAVSIDLSEQGAIVRAYRAPQKLNADLVKRRLDSVLAVLPEVLQIPAENIFLEE